MTWNIDKIPFGLPHSEERKRYTAARRAALAARPDLTKPPGRQTVAERREANRLRYLQARQDFPEYHRARKRRWHKTKVGAVSLLVSSAKQRAKQFGLPFDLQPSDISIPEVCPVLGIKIGTGERERAPSLDRIIPSLGYVRGNVMVISFRANRLKNDASAEELYALYNYVRSSASPIGLRRLSENDHGGNSRAGGQADPR